MESSSAQATLKQSNYMNQLLEAISVQTLLKETSKECKAIEQVQPTTPLEC